MDMNDRSKMKFTLTLFAYLLTLFAYSQTEFPEFHPEEMVTVPKTPEAAAFTEYANNNSVMHYTGKASINVPLHNVAGRKLGHNVSLDYIASGIKVGQAASNVGLGWNLNAGGFISRNINGLPDDYLDAYWKYYPFYSEVVYPNIILTNGQSQSKTVFEQYKKFMEKNMAPGSAGNYDSMWVERYIHFRQHITEHKFIDTQPDTYSFSAGNLSGTLFIDYETGSAYCVEIPDLQVTVNFGAPDDHGVKVITSWELKDNQGTIYVFDLTESTRVEAGDFQSVRTYTSGWYLTSINNTFFGDFMTFNYSDEYTTHEFSMGGLSDMLRDKNPNTIDDCGEGSWSIASDVKYRHTKRYLSEIVLNNLTAVDFQYSTDTEVFGIPTRLDLDNEPLLGKIWIYDVERLVQEYELKYSYFGPSNPTTIYESRLKLDRILIKGDWTALDYQEYKFDYSNIELPDRISYSQDYWGYYNGFSNLSLIPADPLYDLPTSTVGNRNPNPAKIEAGILKTIHYPTGGSTTFTYKPNSYVQPELLTQDIYITGAAFLGGVDPTDSIGYYSCDDVALGAPIATKKKFVIDEADNYRIKVRVLGNSQPQDVQAVSVYAGTPLPLCDLLQYQAFPIWQSGQVVAEEVVTWLEPGIHNIFIMNDQPDVTIEVEVYRTTTETTDVLYLAGGVRIIKKEDKDDLGVVAKSTIYYYDDITEIGGMPTPDLLLSSTATSGKLHHLKNFNVPYFTEELYIPQNTECQAWVVSCEYVDRHASNRATPTSNVLAYNTVSVVDVDPNGNLNGATVYDFYNEFEGVGDRPYIKYRALNGKVKDEKIYTFDYQANSFVLQQHTYNEFVKQPLLNSQSGFYFRPTESKFVDIKLIKTPNFSEDPGVGNRMVFHDYTIMPVTGICSDDPQIGKNVPRPTPCVEFPETMDLECFYGTFDPRLMYEQVPYGITHFWVQLKSTTVTRNEGGPSMTIVQNYVYDDPSLSQYQVRRHLVDHLGKADEEAVFTYASDLGYTALINQNRVAEPVRVKRIVNAQTQSMKNTLYDGQGRPINIQIAHGTDDLAKLEDRTVVNRYDSKNNIMEVVTADGLTHTYVWGYNQTLPVAHIVGASWDEMVAALNHSVILDDDNNQTMSNANHTLLRDNLPNALVTTYAYDPGFGMTRQTDPSGLSTYYEYDTFGRLRFIRDHEGNILQQFEYHLIGPTE